MTGINQSAESDVRQAIGHGEGRRKGASRGGFTAGSSSAGPLQGPGFAAGQADSWEQLLRGNHNPCSEEG